MKKLWQSLNNLRHNVNYDKENFVGCYYSAWKGFYIWDKGEGDQVSTDMFIVVIQKKLTLRGGRSHFHLKQTLVLSVIS